MTNQEAYEELCDKAEKYDKLVKAIGEIKIDVLDVIDKIDIKTPEVHSLNPKIRSVYENENGNILVGTRGGEILEIENGNPTVYLRGHWDKELWGMCANPKKNQYFTVGQDKLLGVLDI